jgi:hypothetical protein
MTVLILSFIPYPVLKTFANPEGPIPALPQSDDHWLTTKTRKMTTDAQKPQLIEIPQVSYHSVVS